MQKDSNNHSRLTAIASIATIIGVCISVIALVPAFGQWLNPLHQNLIEPQIQEVQTAITSDQPSDEISISPTSTQEGGILSYLSSENISSYKVRDIEVFTKNNGSHYIGLGLSATEFAIQTDVEWDTVGNSENLSSIGCGFRIDSYRHRLTVFIAMDGYSYSNEMIGDENKVYERINNNKAKYGNPSNLSGKAKISIIVNDKGYFFFVNNNLILQSNNLYRNSTYTDDVFVLNEKSLVYTPTVCNFQDINVWVVTP